MKTLIKINIAFMCSILLICSTAYAMEIELNKLNNECTPLKSAHNYYQIQTNITNTFHEIPFKNRIENIYKLPLKNIINTIHEQPLENIIDAIPKLPLKDISAFFNLLSEEQQNQLLATKNNNNKTLAESLPLKIARFLPKEIQLNILRLLMDNDELSAKLFYETPLWYAHKRYYDAKKKIQKLLTKTNMDPLVDAVIIYFTDPLPTDKSIPLFFRSSKDTQKKIIINLTPSRKPIDEGRIIIDESQQKEILSFNPDIQKTFFADKNIIIMTKDERSNVATGFGIVSLTGGMCGLVCGGIIALAAGITTGNPIWYIVPPCVGILGGGISGGFIGQLFYVRDARDNAQKLKV
jgi:hypothetical protein